MNLFERHTIVIEDDKITKTTKKFKLAAAILTCAILYFKLVEVVKGQSIEINIGNKKREEESEGE